MPTPLNCPICGHSGLCLNGKHLTLTALTFADLARPLRVGGHDLPNRVFLAPMSGVSDRPFRRIAATAGAGLVVSEMVASHELATGNAEAATRAQATGIGLHVVQLAGRETRWMAEGARAAAGAGADIIDINMGCPAKKVTGGYSGSALMRDLDHATRLIDATIAASPVPVTLKMRLGWDEATINAPDLAQRAEQAGVAMITVHGRTRCQFYTGRADWAAIRAVKDAVAVPVIANGDMTGRVEIEAALALSGADGVMLGRGAYGRPTLPGEIARWAAGGPALCRNPAEEIVAAAKTHYEAMLAHYGVAIGLRMARKHLGWTIDRLVAGGTEISGELRGRLLTEGDAGAVLRLLDTLVAPRAGDLRRAA